MLSLQGGWRVPRFVEPSSRAARGTEACTQNVSLGVGCCRIMEPIDEGDDGSVKALVVCHQYEESVALYSLMNTFLIFASLTLGLVFSCGFFGRSHRRRAHIGRLTVTWGAGLFVCGIVLAATWPEEPEGYGCAAVGGAFGDATSLTIFSGALWFLRGRRELHAERRRPPSGSVDDDIAFGEAIPDGYVDARGAVDLDDGDTPLLSDDDDDDDGSLDEDASVEHEGYCELTSVCVVAP